MFVPFDLPEPPKPPTAEEMKAMDQNPRAFAGRYTSGMSLRDYFAGQALIATYMNGFAGPENPHRAAICYAMADAMLAERAKQGDR